MKIVKNDHYAKAIAFAKCPFGSNRKIAKNMQKNDSTRILELFYAKNRLAKAANVKKKRHFSKLAKLATMQRPLHNGHFGAKTKIARDISKTTLHAHYSCSVQETAPEKSLYSKNETSLKIGKNGLYAKAIASPKWSLWGIIIAK